MCSSQSLKEFSASQRISNRSTYLHAMYVSPTFEKIMISFMEINEEELNVIHAPCRRDVKKLQVKVKLEKTSDRGLVS